MHIGIVFLMNIWFFDLMLLLLIFYDFSGVRARIGRWLLQRAGNVKVLYDGACPFCRRTVRVLRAMDFFGRVIFLDFRRADIPQLTRTYPGVTLAALDNEMFVIADEQAYPGFEGYRRLALVLPALWPLVPVLYFPGARPVGRRAYAYVARHRLAFVTCDDTCPTEDRPAEMSIAGSPGRPPRFAAWQLVLAGLIAVQTMVWLNSLEFYPFTSVQMFKGKPGTVVTYFKTVAHWESGRVAPIYLEDTLDVLSINSRYEGLFDLCFGDPEQTALCRRTLMIMGSAYNGKNGSSDRLKQLEIQRWKWDFEARPRDPRYGELDATFVGDVQSAGVAAAPAGSRNDP
jgi:predicted DCC family thiol-disulfide oxidoreductase YuxK